MDACLRFRNIIVIVSLALLSGCKSVDTPPNLTEHEQNLKQTQSIMCHDETDVQKLQPLETQILNPIAFYPMGITSSQDSTVYTEQIKSRILSHNGSENSELWSLTGCGPSSIESDNETFLITCYQSSSLIRISKSSPVKILDTYFGYRNAYGLSSDGKGGFYFTSAGTLQKNSPKEGEIYFLDSDKRIRKVADGIHYAAGLAVIEKGKFLLVAEQLQNRVLKYKIQENGDLMPIYDQTTIADPQKMESKKTKGKNKKAKPVKTKTAKKSGLKKSKRPLAVTSVFLDLDDLKSPYPDPTGGLRGPDQIWMNTDNMIFVSQYASSRILKYRMERKKSKFVGSVVIDSEFQNLTHFLVQGTKIYLSASQINPANQNQGIVFTVNDPILNSRRKLICSPNK
jgi:hypothetical protein